jgi:hypothetical protein
VLDGEEEICTIDVRPPLAEVAVPFFFYEDPGACYHGEGVDGYHVDAVDKLGVCAEVC